MDDILITSHDEVNIRRLKEELAKNFVIRDLGCIKYCLGIEVSQSKKGIHLSQAGYIRDVMNRFGITDCKPVRTPLDTNIKLHDAIDDSDGDELKLPYRELLGSLMYLVQGTRPDIAHAVSAISQ
ncbi:unnamed protein product [Lasius platythorax]|uniref:Reverse transcriptase Ty1/copia-type domain-containing protein n=1 Tax=Lasius platythorax TaxID=488582 RepID=A0AAV2MZ16_9HYME